MSFDYLDEKKVEKSIIDFSEGNTFPLFKLALSSLYDARKILDDQNFIINMFKNLNNYQEKMEFIDLLIDKRIKFLTEVDSNDTSHLNRYNITWGNKLPEKTPLIFHLIPYLQDGHLAKIVQDGSIYSITENPDIKLLAETLTIDLFKKGFKESIISLKDDYYIFNHLNVYDKKTFAEGKEEQTLEEHLFEFTLNNPDLLEAFSRITYSGLDSTSDKWLNTQLEKEKKDNSAIQKFLDNTFPKLSEEGKESAIAYMLYKTDDLDFLKIALNKIGVDKIQDYKPNKIPLWLQSAQHNNKSIYRKLLRTGTQLFDYYAPANRTFLACMVDGLPRKDFKLLLEEQKIDLKSFMKDLLDSQVDSQQQVYTNFSLLYTTGESFFTDFLNFKVNDLEIYSKDFKESKYSKLKPIQKLTLISEILDKTYLAETYVPEGIYYSKHIKKAELNFNLHMSHEYHPRNSIHLIEEHLTLLEQTNFKGKDYRPIYFKIAKQMFDHYSSGRIHEDTDIYKLYNKIIDYVGTDKSLDWKDLNEKLNSEEISKSKNDFQEGSINLFNYLNKVCLSHTLASEPIIERKKFKI